MAITTNIKFPVLRAFDVTGYLLFPGRDGTGVSHSFEKGVSIVAGINGIGKTTLLNALLRLLIGPWDVLREDPDDIGSTRHELVRWRTPDLFANRVPDGAASATIGGWVTFGSERLYVLRALSDLSVKELAHNGTQLTASENTFQEIVTRLSGVDSYFDYHFLVRNLLFYLEDRRPLIWADEGQFEIARVLFVPGPDSTRTSRLYDEIKQLDSRYRNLLTEHNRNLRRLREQRKAQGTAEDIRAAVGAKQEAYAGSHEALIRIDTLLDQSITQEREHSDDLRRQQLDLESSFRAYEGIQQRYFAQAFPKADETFHYIMAHIVSEGGCLVCGSDAKERADELKQEIAEGRCPICHSPPDQQERVISVTEVAAERVNKAAKDLDGRRNAFQSLRAQRDTIAERISVMLDERRDLQQTLDTYRLELAALEARLPVSAAAMSELEAAVNVSQGQVDELAKNRSEAVRTFRILMTNASALIEGKHPAIKQHFQECVKAFLEEECELNYRERERTVGQSGEKIRFPGFDVMLTSGTFPDTPTPRLFIDDVSESQKEFIDLAFRIALIRTASEDQGAMLVLETPEASLDSLFIYRAGDLLRNFANEGGQIGNLLLASSNLNEANMIPALLGIDRNPDTSPQEIDRRMINLLKEAARNKALVAREPQYEKQYQTAITPDPNRLPD